MLLSKNSANIQFKDSDLEWLKSNKNLPQKDLLDITDSRVKPLANLVRNTPKENLPMTIGLFGGWGAGKTTFLGYLAKAFENKDVDIEPYNVIYFNAWKYAGSTEVLPALIYKLLKFSNVSNNKQNLLKDIMISLGSKYGKQLSEWAEKYIGLDIAEFASDIKAIKDSNNNYNELIETYYTSIDKSQDLLEEFYSECTSPRIVLIDELDRCDPGEAFEVIKQLRVFFSMRNIPVIFILTANPEPIGMAIKHQYGLTGHTGDYEAKRIIEKFVDSYIDTSDPISLSHFIRNIWKDSKNFPSLIDIENKFPEIPYKGSKVEHSDVFVSITTNNYLYNNLRVLQKSYKYALHHPIGDSNQFWALWHLEILKQMHPNLRQHIKLMSYEIGLLAANSHIMTYRSLIRLNIIDQDFNVINTQKIEDSKGKAIYSIYRSHFWDLAKNRNATLKETKTFENDEKIKLLQSFINDYHILNFIINMSLISISDEMKDYLRNTWDKQKPDSQFKLYDNWHDFKNFEHFSWLVATY